jgi:hypothetical protein
MSDISRNGPVDPDDPTISARGEVGEAAGLGNQDPITGVPAGASNADLDDDAQLADDGTADEDRLPGDPESVREESLQTVSNDALAGETVHPGLGESNQGPTGGAAREFEPSPSTPVDEGLPDNELAGQDIDLADDSRTLDR